MGRGGQGKGSERKGEERREGERKGGKQRTEEERGKRWGEGQLDPPAVWLSLHCPSPGFKCIKNLQVHSCSIHKTFQGSHGLPPLLSVLLWVLQRNRTRTNRKKYISYIYELLYMLYIWLTIRNWLMGLWRLTSPRSASNTLRIQERWWCKFQFKSECRGRPMSQPKGSQAEKENPSLLSLSVSSGLQQMMKSTHTGSGKALFSSIHSFTGDLNQKHPHRHTEITLIKYLGTPWSSQVHTCNYPPIWQWQHLSATLPSGCLCQAALPLESRGWGQKQPILAQDPDI